MKKVRKIKNNNQKSRKNITNKANRNKNLILKIYKKNNLANKAMNVLIRIKKIASLHLDKKSLVPQV